MKVVVLGSDGRAHALVWKVFNSAYASEVICAPGNGGTALIAPAATVPLDDMAALGRWAFDESIDLIIPADGRPLQRGLVDEVVAFQIGVCGPSQRSAVLEQSRCQAKEFLLRHQLPTAPGRAFRDLPTAEKYLATLPLPVVIKADHPEGNVGLFGDRHAALTGLREIFATQPREDGGSAGVVIERSLSGPRVVLSAFVDGRTAVPLLTTRLYDRISADADAPRADGIGAHTSASRYSQLLSEYLHKKCLNPLVQALDAEGLPYWGMLNIDCIITSSGPSITGIHCSMHNGEAQVVLPRLEDDLIQWVQAMISKNLHTMPAPRWTPGASFGIGLFARGYPHHFATGGPIHGLDNLDDGVLAFHNATENPSGLRYTSTSPKAKPTFFGLMNDTPTFGGLRVDGGAVLTVVATGASLSEARGRALANAERVQFNGRTYRADIGVKEFS